MAFAVRVPAVVQLAARTVCALRALIEWRLLMEFAFLVLDLVLLAVIASRAVRAIRDTFCTQAAAILVLVLALLVRLLDRLSLVALA